MANTNPVIVVHGIRGSWLKDEYPVDYQDSILWTGVLRRNFKALHLHPLDAAVNAGQHANATIRASFIPSSFRSRLDPTRFLRSRQSSNPSSTNRRD